MNKTKQLILTALCAALISISAIIAIPAAVPFTLQTFGVYLSYLVLGAKGGLGAVLVYLFMGAVGLPVFAGGQGGFGVLFGPTGGYLWGFVLMGLLLLPAGKKKLPMLVLGTVVCYVTGSLWFAHVMGGVTVESFVSALTVCVLPYIIPDGVKLYLSYLVYHRLKKAGVV